MRRWATTLIVLALLSLVALAQERALRERYRGVSLEGGMRGEMSPSEFVGTTMLGGARAFVINYLWIQMTDAAREQNTYQAVGAAKAIVALQPNHEAVWAHLAHVIGTNLGGDESDVRRQWALAEDALALLEEGVRRLPQSAGMLKHRAWAVHQFGMRFPGPMLARYQGVLRVAKGVAIDPELRQALALELREAEGLIALERALFSERGSRLAAPDGFAASSGEFPPALAAMSASTRELLRTALANSRYGIRGLLESWRAQVAHSEARRLRYLERARDLSAEDQRRLSSLITADEDRRFEALSSLGAALRALVLSFDREWTFDEQGRLVELWTAPDREIRLDALRDTVVAHRDPDREHALAVLERYERMIYLLAARAGDQERDGVLTRPKRDASDVSEIMVFWSAALRATPADDARTGVYFRRVETLEAEISRLLDARRATLARPRTDHDH